MAWTFVGRILAGTALVVLCLSASQDAQARPTGEPQACGNCHYRTQGPEITVMFSDDKPDPGDTITITVKLKARNSEAKRTGVMLTTEGQGKFGLVEPMVTRMESETQVLHSEPKDLVDGAAQFQFKWTAPDMAGVSDFTIWSITGNSNGDSEDDHSASVRKSIAHGCDAIDYFPDNDEDGFGDKNAAKLSCEPVEGFILEGGDCKDDDALINPDATERCNTQDDDCDGEVDEGLEPDLYYKDDDGDGYASPRARAEFGCNDKEGYTRERGDCAPDDPKIHPGAKEIKNGKDDNCDGRIDETDGGSDDDSSDDGGGGDDRTRGGCSVGPDAGFAPGALALAGLAIGLFLRVNRGRRRPR